MSLDFTDLSAEEQAFKNTLDNAGIPTTAEGLKAEFQGIVTAAGMTMTNTSSYSPFWNLVKALVTTPVLWLLAFLVREVMPNLYAKTARGALLDLIAWAYDVERKPAATATGLLTFSRESVGQPLTIPAGTAVRTIAIDGTVYRMIVAAATAFPANGNTVTAMATAEKSGAAYNLADGYYCILDSDVPGVSGVTNGTGWLTSPGADEEPDDQLRLRVRNQFTAVADWHTDAKYRAMIAGQTGIRADRIFFDHNIPRGPGSADAYILFDTYTPAQAYLDQINAYIQADGNHGHGDDLTVKAMPETVHDVAVTVIPGLNMADAEVTAMIAGIEQFIRCAFRENSDYQDRATQTWPFDIFSFSRLDQELHNEFPAVRSFRWGQADIDSNLDVPRLGILTITRGES